MVIEEKITKFFLKQSFVIVATIDQQGFIHTSCKGLVDIDPELGKVYIFDLYHGTTYKNLKNNNKLSITAVDEGLFVGYCLKGTASQMSLDTISKELKEKWEEKILSRIAKRVISHIQKDKKSSYHPEADMPSPKQIIILTIEEIVDLAKFK